MSDSQRLDAAVLLALRNVLTSDSPLALVEPIKTLARLFADEGASVNETQPSSKGMPNGGLSAHCSRETRLAQVTRKGDCRHATPSLP